MLLPRIHKNRRHKRRDYQSRRMHNKRRNNSLPSNRHHQPPRKSEIPTHRKYVRRLPSPDTVYIVIPDRHRRQRGGERRQLVSHRRHNNCTTFTWVVAVRSAANQHMLDCDTEIVPGHPILCTKIDVIRQQRQAAATRRTKSNHCQLYRTIVFVQRMTISYYFLIN